MTHVGKEKVLSIHKTYGQGSGLVSNTICKIGISKIELLHFFQVLSDQQDCFQLFMKLKYEKTELCMSSSE